MSSAPLLRVVDYYKHFHINKNIFVRAVNGVTFDVFEGEIFSLVGESGSGKSTLAKAAMAFFPASKGEIYFKDYLISDQRSYKKAKKHIQTKLQIVFQDSAAALNPRMTAADIISEPLTINRLCESKAERLAKISELMVDVGLDPIYMGKYPGELSGGQRQRVAVARALSMDPDLIIADEPVASLDVSIQAQIINLFLSLRSRKNIAFLFIAHDLALVRYISDRVGVMYRGKIVELSGTKELFGNPIHPYTQSLLSAIPVPDPVYERQKKIIPFDKSLFNPSGAMLKTAEGHYVLSG